MSRGPGLLPQAPPAAGPRFDSPLPEPPAGLEPALQWGDPTPAPAPPPRQGPTPPISRLAIAAVSLAVLLGGGGLALVLGAIAFFRAQRTDKRGRRLAVAAMVITVAWAAAFAAVYVAVLSKPPARDSNGTLTRKTELTVTQLRVGDCIENWATSAHIGKVMATPCTTTHNAEVFHTFALQGQSYPGDAAVRQQSSSQCTDKAKTAVKAADLKNAKVAYFTPVSGAWQDGQHTVTCVAVQNSGTITRSIRS